ncbi:MAG: acyl-CoA dehydratase activase [Spirochaetes bacterium]|nr:acyl-CoA dehydratase activase [Spirochaetota bacterium]
MQYGIDCGSKFVKIVAIDARGSIVFSEYKEHCGDPAKALPSNLFDSVALTGCHASLLRNICAREIEIDEIASIIAAMEMLRLKFRTVVCVGAASIGLIGLDDRMQFESYRQNTLCAAGTGSFIDEQMHRLGFSYSDIAEIPIDESPPTIATRCAVFAKSDVVHRQQEGYGQHALWSGLCRGVSMTMLQSVFRGELPDEEVLFIGGLFLNPTIRYWTSRLFPQARFHEMGHFFGAWGSALLHRKGFKNAAVQFPLKTKGSAARKKLELKNSRIIGERDVVFCEKNGCEVRIHKHCELSGKAAVGIDIGSTSTKLVLLDAHSHEVIVDIYARTQGNPLGAAARLFAELKEAIGNNSVEICACATTGSGRKLVGAVVGADLIINEISAHFAGAFHIDPSIETIFEIGGQDSKYIRASRGVVVDYNMNFVCAAGTGSFIEEQAQRLGFRVHEIGKRVIGVCAPQASDRCTVFMEQDINALLREGHSKEEALAAVVFAIAKNYLNRVVGTRPITGTKIFFQGATARNFSLVAAFEILTGKEIVVSPYCHVMGAVGAARLVLQRMKGSTRFRGFDSLTALPTFHRAICEDCTNRCAITYANFRNGDTASWGQLCGRGEVGQLKKRGRNYIASAFDAILAKDNTSTTAISQCSRGTVGIPMMLSMFNYLSLWQTFLSLLNFQVIVSDPSQKSLRERAVKISRTDFCFPVKLALAHFEQLARNHQVDILFAPVLVSEKMQRNGMPRVFCPYVISIASIAASMDFGKTILMPVVDFRDTHTMIVEELHRVFEPYGIGKDEIAIAFEKSLNELNFRRKIRFQKGCTAIANARSTGKKFVVFIGRPYNLYDTLLNLHLPDHFAKYGVDVIPFEMLIDEKEDEIPHMYWNYGSLILRMAKKIKAMKNVYPVYLTNFSCGPDSFVLSRFEAIMEGKPYLIIELDEHGSETGYLTRIEAFLDIIMEDTRDCETTSSERSPFVGRWNKKSRTLWIPPMHEIGARLFAAGFRAWGFNAEALPPEDECAGEIGKQSIRGSECLPAAATIGAFLKKMRELNANPAKQAIFMPTAEGPCRFGQYAVLHRRILDREGFSQTMIFAPTSVNSYMGMPSSLRRYLWDVILASDYIMKAILKVRPYELHRGETDSIVEELLQLLERRIEQKANVLRETIHAVEEILSIPHEPTPRPLVGIVGEIYVRCNPFCNDNLIRTIEACYGEAWLSPISEWVLYTSWFENYITQRRSKNPIKKALANVKHSYLYARAHEFEYAFRSLMGNRLEPLIEDVLNEGIKYLPLRFEGEAILTIGRTRKFFDDGASMVVNCAPFGCMPGNITASIFCQIQHDVQKPILTLFYDGESSVNKAVEIYLKNMNVPQKMEVSQRM